MMILEHAIPIAWHMIWESLMKSIIALLIGTALGISPVLAQSTSTFTFKRTGDGYQSNTTWSDGSSVTTTSSGSKSTSTYQAPGTGYQPMGRNGYNPVGNASPTASDARLASPSPLYPRENTGFSVNNGQSGIKAAPAMTKEELEVYKAKQVEWEGRCRPMFVEDAEGIRRAQYAEKDCDLSSFNTAGP
jgi:hypothetical protein